MKKYLKILVIISLCINCKGQTDEKVKEENMNNIIQNSNTIVEDTLNYIFKINLGFVDKPVWMWAIKIDNLKMNKKVYTHIYEITYLDEYNENTILFYEFDREKEIDKIDLNNYIIDGYPGDSTLRLMKDKDTLILFNVLPAKNLNREFKGIEYYRIPTLDYNKSHEKVSGYDIEINIQHISEDNYIVNMIDNDGYRQYKGKSNCPFEDIKMDFISYYDNTNKTIFFLNKGCNLKFLKDNIENGSN